MKRRLFLVKWIISILLLTITVLPTIVNGFIQSPSDENISSAIKSYFRKTPPWETIRATFLPRNPQVQTVRIERRGPYNDQKGYWPVKAYVKGTVGAGWRDKTTPCTFEGITDFHIFKDDYGDWSARVAVPYLAEQQLRPDCDFGAAESGRPTERPRTEEKKSVPAPSGRVDYPSSRFRTYTELNLFSVTVPENWLKLPAQNAVTFAPEGGHGVHQGNFVFTHGMQFGTSRVNQRTLRQATDDLLNLLSQGKRDLRRQSEFRPERIARRDALCIVLTNISEVTRQSEYVTIYTTLLSAGNLFYVICVAPEGDYPSYQTVFQKIVRSIELKSGSLSGRLLFSSRRDGNQDVYCLDLATGLETNLTRNGADDGYPRWSPAGDRIAFSTNRDGNWEVYSMNRDGSRPINLSRNSAGDGYLDWSADGELLVFASNRNDSRANDILSMRADGSIVTKLITSSGEDVHPVWSPSRADIAFASERDGNRQIYIWNSSSDRVTRLMSNSGYDDYPTWSPDGSRIAFASDRDSGASNRLDIYVATIERPSRWYNIEGKRTLVRVGWEWSVTSVLRVVSHLSDDRHPTWSPDGKMLAFVSNRDGDRDVFVINADGAGLKKIVGAKGDDEHPHWVSESPAVARRTIPPSTHESPSPTDSNPGEELIVKLENPVGTTTHRERGTEATINRVGDVISFSVTSPARYRGARVKAHIGLIRSSWLSNQQAQLGLIFDSIEINGETRRFGASIEKVSSSTEVKRMRRIDGGYSVSPLISLRIQRSGDLTTLILDGSEEFGLDTGAEIVIKGRIGLHR